MVGFVIHRLIFHVSCAPRKGTTSAVVLNKTKNYAGSIMTTPNHLHTEHNYLLNLLYLCVITLSLLRYI